MLGTVRPDGSPRISPVEPYLVGGQLLIGAMAWSRKSADLHRDPRYVLHSVVTGPDVDGGIGPCRKESASALLVLRKRSHTRLSYQTPPILSALVKFLLSIHRRSDLRQI